MKTFHRLILSVSRATIIPKSSFLPSFTANLPPFLANTVAKAMTPAKRGAGADAEASPEKKARKSRGTIVDSDQEPDTPTPV